MDWSREELNASVAAYIQMRDLEQRGEKFTKKSFYHELSNRFGRSPKSFEFRMQNISHVYNLMGRDWIKGLKPARNVGTNVLPVIEELILQNEGTKGIPMVEFEEQVSKLPLMLFFSQSCFLWCFLLCKRVICTYILPLIYIFVYRI